MVETARTFNGLKEIEKFHAAYRAWFNNRMAGKLTIPRVEHVCGDFEKLPLKQYNHLPKWANSHKNVYVPFLVLTSSQERAALLSKQLKKFNYWNTKNWPPKDSRTPFAVTSVNCIRDFIGTLSFNNTYLVIIDTECFGAYKQAPPVLFKLIHDHFNNGRINLCLLLSDIALHGAARNSPLASPHKNTAYENVEMSKKMNDAAKKDLEKALKKKRKADEQFQVAKSAQARAEKTMQQAMKNYLNLDQKSEQPSYASPVDAIDVDALDDIGVGGKRPGAPSVNNGNATRKPSPKRTGKKKKGGGVRTGGNNSPAKSLKKQKNSRKQNGGQSKKKGGKQKNKAKR